MLQLTPSQQKALSTERHLAITANAGSGKTRVLVERYVNLFEARPNLTVQNVVAITFTENAGAELRKKILAEVNERIATLPRVDERRYLLARLRDTLPNAFIGTIHAFASRMLRAYPVEANVDASFIIVQGADERLMREDAIQRVFYSELEEAYEHPDESPVLHLFRALGRQDVTQLVRTLLRNPARSGALREKLLALSDDQIISLWRAEAEKLLQYPLAARDVIADLQAHVKGGKRAEEVIPLFGPYFKATGVFEMAHAFYELANLLVVTKKETINSQRIDLKALAPDLEPERDEFIAYFLEKESLLKSIPPSENEWIREHREYIALMKTAAGLSGQVAEEYLNDKATYGLLDFDDLIQRFRRLLEEPRVRDELSAQFRFIMIDEFQDTDASQFELARLLTENFGAQSNLMIVGDPKQSIYGFRNADVSVFHSTQNAIAAQALTPEALNESMALGLGPEEEHGQIQLGESFRMASRPLAAINRVFSALMQPDSKAIQSSHEVEYSDLIHGRIADVPGGVEWICPKKPAKAAGDAVETDESTEEDATEAELIARKIVGMVGNPSYQIEEKGVTRASRYDDIAILLRSRTNLPLIERALRSSGIPFTVAKGAGFFLQQEILDVTSYLSFLIAPHDDLALAAILRSPFFALSDVDLYQIAHFGAMQKNDRALSFWEKLARYCSEHPKPHLVHAHHQLESNLAIAGRTGAAFLIEKIYAEAGIYATLSARTDGKQKIANLEKFLGMARASDAGGFSSLFDFVERIRYLIDEDEKESQADSVSGMDAVQIMTVHAAKGLEFPIVFIPFLQKQFQFDVRGMLEPELGLHIRFAESERQPFIAELLRTRSRARTIAEEKRIFYAAMTRARDHLILSSTLPPKPPKNSWLEWAASTLPAVFDESCKTIALEERILRYDSTTRETSETILRFDVPLLRTAEDIPLIESIKAPEAVKTIGPFHLAPVRIERSVSRYSATQFLRFRECPTKYHLSYALGMPEESRLAYDLEADQLSETVRGPLLGQIVHRALSKIDALLINGSLNDPKCQRELDSIFFSLGVFDESERTKLATSTRKHIENFLISTLASNALSASETRSEFSLQAQIPSGNTLYGIIDRLYRNAEGIWTILDYKTERSTSEERNRTNRERHRFQLRFYAYLVHLMYPEEESIRAILFYTERGESEEFSFGLYDFVGIESECEAMIERIHENESVRDLHDLERNLDHCPDCKFFDQSANSCLVLSASEPNRYAREIAILT